jgi:large subunit ribosomal protein L15
MFELNKLPKIGKKRKKRLGQGHGSGRGKTAGRGTKGQKSREKMSSLKTSEILSLVKRLPLIRGKYRNSKITQKKIVINVKYLNLFEPNSIIDQASLIKAGIIDSGVESNSIKILGDGEIRVPLIVKLKCSRGAKEKIEKVGGKIEYQNNTKVRVPDKQTSKDIVEKK